MKKTKNKGIELIKKLGHMPPNELGCDQLIEYFDFDYHCDERYEFTGYYKDSLVGIKAVSRGNGYLGVIKDLRGSQKPICIVGKGIVFDSGGADLKNNSRGMKYDMLGAATVLALARHGNIKRSMMYYGCVADNYFGEGQLYPDYVLRYPDGTRVEIDNTDAEGRLVLADGILEAKKHKPKLIITIATLTGAAKAALGPATAVFSNRGAIAKKFLKCVGDELAWHLPIWDVHRENIKVKSPVADIKNCGTIAGASTAAAFLEHFAGDTPWLHLDIAGSAYNDDGPTGCMYEPLRRFLKLI